MKTKIYSIENNLTTAQKRAIEAQADIIRVACTKIALATSHKYISCHFYDHFGYRELIVKNSFEQEEDRFRLVVTI